MLRFFKQPLPQVLATIILLATGLWVGIFFKGNSTIYYFDYTQMPFYTMVMNIIPTKGYIQNLIGFLIVLFLGFYLLQLNSKYIIIKNRTYLPALFFLLLLSSLPVIQRINPAIFSAVLIVFALDHIFSLYHKDDALNDIFMASFFISAASLFYAPAIIYFLMLILSILSLRNFQFRELLVAIFGVATPWFLYSFYCFVFLDNWSYGIELLYENLFIDVEHSLVYQYILYIFGGFLLLLFIISGYFLLNSLQSQKIVVRKYFGVFMWYNLTSFAIGLFLPSRSFEFFYLISIPLVFQFAYYFSQSNAKFWPKLLFNLLILVVITSQVLPWVLLKWQEG